MNYLNFKNQLQDYLIFSLNDIKKIEPSFQRRRLNEWQDKGYIQKIIRKYYIFSDIATNEQIIFLIANKIYPPTYISLEMALSFYGFIPESVYGITSVTSKHTHKFHTLKGDFIYRHLKPELFFGYQLMDYQNHSFKIAEPEKAVLDFFYLNPNLKTKNDFYELRFNKEEFLQKVNLNKLREYLKSFSSKSLEKRITLFLKFLKNA